MQGATGATNVSHDRIEQRFARRAPPYPMLSNSASRAGFSVLIMSQSGRLRPRSPGTPAGDWRRPDYSERKFAQGHRLRTGGTTAGANLKASRNVRRYSLVLQSGPYNLNNAFDPIQSTPSILHNAPYNLPRAVLRNIEQRRLADFVCVPRIRRLIAADFGSSVVTMSSSSLRPFTMSESADSCCSEAVGLRACS